MYDEFKFNAVFVAVLDVVALYTTVLLFIELSYDIDHNDGEFVGGSNPLNISGG